MQAIPNRAGPPCGTKKVDASQRFPPSWADDEEEFSRHPTHTPKNRGSPVKQGNVRLQRRDDRRGGDDRRGDLRADGDRRGSGGAGPDHRLRAQRRGDAVHRHGVRGAWFLLPHRGRRIPVGEKLPPSPERVPGRVDDLVRLLGGVQSLRPWFRRLFRTHARGVRHPHSSHPVLLRREDPRRGRVPRVGLRQLQGSFRGGIGRDRHHAGQGGRHSPVHRFRSLGHAWDAGLEGELRPLPSAGIRGRLQRHGAYLHRISGVRGDRPVQRGGDGPRTERPPGDLPGLKYRHPHLSPGGVRRDRRHPRGGNALLAVPREDEGACGRRGGAAVRPRRRGGRARRGASLHPERAAGHHLLLLPRRARDGAGPQPPGLSRKDSPGEEDPAPGHRRLGGDRHLHGAFPADRGRGEHGGYHVSARSSSR